MLAPAPDVRFVGVAANEEDLWALLARTQPRVLVLDLHHPGRDGLALCAEVKRRHIPPAVVLYTAAAHPDVTIAAVIAGADAILHKTAPPAALLHTIRSSAVPASGPPPAVARDTRRAPPRDWTRPSTRSSPCDWPATPRKRSPTR
jgi:DNA-binding NarL/FixJ family response regulator